MIGDGPEGRRLRRLAGPTVTFTGRIPDAQVAEILAGARALVVTAVEEFGIAAVEALAAGRPVIALGEGGVRESVQPGVTGAFYERNDPAALAETVLAFDALAVDSGGVPRRRRALQRRRASSAGSPRSWPTPSRTSVRRGRASARCSRPGCFTARAGRAGRRGGAGHAAAHRSGSSASRRSRSLSAASRNGLLHALR